ncbi:hypothetical protein QP166_04250 [Sphingomonas sp. LR60]|uniref:hypothetical protein n=1 Tax=Sphingomonas sp. LR60 TaxID=3050233 RepID=UPI002FDFCA17
MVEDEAELARRTIASLTRAGITGEWLASAEDAAGFVEDGFNALIVDLGLPGMGGSIWCGCCDGAAWQFRY